MDEFFDSVLEVIMFPLLLAAVFLPFAAIGSAWQKEFRGAVLYGLAALACYALARGIGKYFDLKKSGSK